MNSKNVTASKDYSLQVGFTPVLNTDNTQSEQVKNGQINSDDTVLNKPPNKTILHGKIIQSQILDNLYQRLGISWWNLMHH